MTRQHHLDALRALAMSLGIVLHASFAFNGPAESPGPTGGWLLHWIPTSIHTFRMPLFFLMAGLFGAMLLTRGEGPFVRNRAERIALPFAVGIALLLPLISVMNDWAADKPLTPSINGPGHLWFLGYLLVYYLVALVVTRLPFAATVGRVGATVADALFRGRWALVKLIAATTLVLILLGGWDQDPARTFVPDPAALGFYGCFFALGWFLWTSYERLSALEAHPSLHAALALGLSVLLVELEGRWYGRGEGGPLDPDVLPYLVVGTIVGWLAIAALYGYAVRLFRSPRPAVRYVVDASYWMYLMHIPVLIVLDRLATEAGLPWWIGFPLAVAAATAILVASYAAVVRHTFVGRVLHGPRTRPGTATGAS